MLFENYAERSHGLEFLLSETPKQQRSGVLKPVKIRRVLHCDKICPVACIEEYMKRTRAFRDLEDGISRVSLFLSLSGLHRQLTSGTIASWIKEGMTWAGIDTSSYKAHSIRSATVSTVRSRGVSLKAIMKRGQWKSSSVLKQFYLRDLNREGGSFHIKLLCFPQAFNRYLFD